MMIQFSLLKCYNKTLSQESIKKKNRSVVDRDKPVNSVMVMGITQGYQLDMVDYPMILLLLYTWKDLGHLPDTQGFSGLVSKL